MNIPETPSYANSLNDFNQKFESADVSKTLLKGRRFHKIDINITDVRYDDLLREALILAKQGKLTKKEITKTINILDNLNKKQPDKETSLAIHVMTSVRSYFGSFNFNRQFAIDQLECIAKNTLDDETVSEEIDHTTNPNENDTFTTQDMLILEQSIKEKEKTKIAELLKDIDLQIKQNKQYGLIQTSITDTSNNTKIEQLMNEIEILLKETKNLMNKTNPTTKQKAPLENVDAPPKNKSHDPSKEDLIKQSIQPLKNKIKTINQNIDSISKTKQEIRKKSTEIKAIKNKNIETTNKIKENNENIKLTKLEITHYKENHLEGSLNKAKSELVILKKNLCELKNQYNKELSKLMEYVLKIEGSRVEENPDDETHILLYKKHIQTTKEIKELEIKICESETLISEKTKEIENFENSIGFQKASLQIEEIKQENEKLESEINRKSETISKLENSKKEKDNEVKKLIQELEEPMQEFAEKYNKLDSVKEKLQPETAKLMEELELQAKKLMEDYKQII